MTTVADLNRVEQIPERDRAALVEVLMDLIGECDRKMWVGLESPELAVLDTEGFRYDLQRRLKLI